MNIIQLNSWAVNQSLFSPKGTIHKRRHSVSPFWKICVKSNHVTKEGGWEHWQLLPLMIGLLLWGVANKCTAATNRAQLLSPIQKKSLRFEAKKLYDFDRNQKRYALYKKEQPNTTGKKPRKFKLIKYIWLLGQ